MIFNDFFNGLIGGTVSALLLSPLDAFRIQKQLGDKLTLNREVLKRATVGCLAAQPAFWAVFWSIRKEVKKHVNVYVEPWISSSISSFICNPLFCFRTRVSALDHFNLSIRDVWKVNFALRDKWTRGLGATFFHNIQFSALVPLVESYKDKQDTLSTTILKTAVSKIIVGTIWYPVEVFRTFRRMGIDDSISKFFLKTPPHVHWQGYGMFLIRTVPQTAIALGGTIWLTNNQK
tara:strand:+ start:1005 stop:1703 length:699 start_codon:yes stop_codon:yes gene_type:complete